LRTAVFLLFKNLNPELPEDFLLLLPGQAYQRMAVQECIKKLACFFCIKVIGNNSKAGFMFFIQSVFQTHRWMKQPLHPIYDKGTILLLFCFNNSLHAQDFAAVDCP